MIDFVKTLYIKFVSITKCLILLENTTKSEVQSL